LNLTEGNIANNALATLSGSGQTAPTYWLDTTNGISHLVNMQTPQDQLASMNDLETIPIDRGNGDPGGQQSQLLGALGTVTQTGTPLLVSHYSILPSIDIYVSNQGRDLGAVYDQVAQVAKEMKSQLPKGAAVHLRGQATTMGSAYVQLLGGLALSVLLVYLVIVVNFQSWLDPFIIITALPGALAGIVWSLFLTHTNGSVPALTGAIMCMGTATANSILVVSFARERLAEHGDAIAAAIEANPQPKEMPILPAVSTTVAGTNAPKSAIVISVKMRCSCRPISMPASRRARFIVAPCAARASGGTVGCKENAHFGVMPHKPTRIKPTRIRIRQNYSAAVDASTSPTPTMRSVAELSMAGRISTAV